ncbi:Transporter of the ATP-binding cassette (ABC), partial [Coemansia sp. RSA 1836]
IMVSRAMSITARVASSVGFAAVAVWLLRQATGYASLLLDDKHQRKIICGKKWRWEWSLESDCFRVGLVWPVVLWLTVIISSAALAVYCLLPGSFTSNGFCGTGSREKPVRRPLGPVIMRDNRTRVGSVVVALSIVQAAVLLYAMASIPEFAYYIDMAYYTHVYTSLVAQLAVLIAVANAIFFAIYLFSDRMLYAGLFPWPLPTLVLVHLLVGSCEIYYSFFTPATRNVPIFGRKASLYANTVVISTLISAITLLTYTRAQLRPVFVRPLLPGSAADPQYLEYSPASDVEANENDDEATPLARRADQKPVPLVETSEFNVSWYSTLAFSWTNDILRRGTVRPLEATDLCYLDESDMPIPSWRRYLRHRKPGRSLLVTMLLTFAPELVLQAVLGLTTSVLYFSGPFFLQRILRSIELLGGKSDGIGHSRPAEKSIRGAYLDAFGLLFFTLAATTLSNQTLWVGRHIGMRIKGILVAELSSKTLRRRGKGTWEDAKSATDGDEDKDADEDDMDAAPTAQAAADGKIMNLLTADFSKVSEVAAYLDNTYSMPLMLFIGIWYMYLLLGVSALVGLSMTVFYIPLSKMLFKYLTKVEEKLTSLSDERVTVITELLQGIKAVKL